MSFGLLCRNVCVRLLSRKMYVRVERLFHCVWTLKFQLQLRLLSAFTVHFKYILLRSLYQRYLVALWPCGHALWKKNHFIFFFSAFWVYINIFLITNTKIWALFFTGFLVRLSVYFLCKHCLIFSLETGWRQLKILSRDNFQ